MRTSGMTWVSECTGITKIGSTRCVSESSHWCVLSEVVCESGVSECE